jgi:hypothetical protein
MTTEIATVVGKELAVIEDAKPPWHERVWDTAGCPEWDRRVYEALRNRNPTTLNGLIRQLELEDRRWAARDPRMTRPTYVFIFAADIMAAYMPLIGRRV